MSNKTLRTYLVAAIIAVVVGYYVYSSIRGVPPLSIIRGRSAAAVTKFVDVNFKRFAGAETLRTVKSDELAAEVKEVINQFGLPADVFVEDTLEDINKKGGKETNIAVILDNLFYGYYVSPNPDDNSQKPDDSLEKLWDASPIGDWNINESTLAGVRATLTSFESKRQAIRTMLSESDTRFYYIFIHPDSLTSLFSATITINTEASKYLSDYALLEEYAIAQALLKGDIDEAVDALAYIFRIAQLASLLGNVGARSDAAMVRLRAFDVMQRVILDPKFDRARMVVLRNILREQYDEWTAEYTAWFGDRASGISLYHRIQMFGPDDALEQEELDNLEKRNIDIDRTFYRGFTKYHEADEAFYLRSMQKILNVSKEPFEKRLDVLNQIYRELSKTENTYDDTGITMEFFVANILLKDVDRLMRLFTQDKSALSRTLVLMDTSLGQSRTDRYRDPFTDEPYEIQKADGLLSVSIPNLPRPFRVPNFMEKE